MESVLSPTDVIGENRQKSEGRQATALGRLRVAICPPELEPLQRVMRGGAGDATYILQSYVVSGLQARGHNLTFMAQRNLNETICTTDLRQPTPGPQTWSASRWFDLASKVTWRLQQWLGVPYLNVFSSYRFYDTCLHCLPGHDVVYERNGLYKSGVAMACRRLGLPYVLFVEADEIMEHDYMGKPLTGLLRWRAKRMFQYNLDSADCVICVSEQSKGHLVTNWNIPADKVVVFPNAVNVQRFRPYPEARQDVRASLNVGDNPLLIFVGNFYEWHDVATLLEAFAQLLTVRPEARLVLVGDGAQRQAMMERATELVIDHATQFTGFVSHADVPRLMSAADIAVAPYPVLNHALWLSPLKLYEYMATGTPVVASAIGQMVEVVQENYNGLLVPPGDAPAMATALQKLIDEPTLRERLGQQARQVAVQNHSWDYYIARLERLFEALITGQPIHLI